MLLLLLVLSFQNISAQTIITVTDCNLNGWVDLRYPNTTTAITTNAPNPPLGTGSLEYTTQTGALGNFRNESFHNTLLASLTTFKYSTYIQSRTNDTDNIFVVLQVDRTGDGLADDHLIFEPRWQTGSWVAGILPDQGPTVENTWQTWDMLHAIWWLGPPRVLNPEKGGEYLLLAAYISQYPEARIVNQPLGGGIGGIRVNVGSPRFAPFIDYWGGAFTGYLDAFTIGINGHTTIYNFEPSIANAGEDKTVVYGYGAHCTTLKARAAGGISPYSYQWSAGGRTWTSAEISVCPTVTTTYSLKVTDAQGCSGTDEVTVFVKDVRCGKKEDKVLVCHKGKMICIAQAAVKAHLQHGDQIGSCSSDAIAQSRNQNTQLDFTEANAFEPKQLRLSNYPNPFGSHTTIQYQLPFDGVVSLNVYDTSGRLVSTLVSGNKKAGTYSVGFSRNNLRAGVYFYKLIATDGLKSITQTQRMIQLE
ncbi:T9SS type A sorting domain-containing protein [Rufibacter hautae]|uniref:T9SS type A sorting domain-containing protein n=1 Tax=Rufibacter hautae TaxID=2595005 RepID=UPI00168016AA|nr:T9SS type A sorting domain-containing protein [Rufibacter hautae]